MKIRGACQLEGPPARPQHMQNVRSPPDCFDRPDRRRRSLAQSPEPPPRPWGRTMEARAIWPPHSPGPALGTGTEESSLPYLEQWS